MSRARDTARIFSLAEPSYTDIILLDDISQNFNGGTVKFQLTYNDQPITILNPLRLLLMINGIIQSVEQDYGVVWLSGISKDGFRIDSEGYLIFSEPPQPGYTFEARYLPGTDNYVDPNSGVFDPLDILLGV